jgi:DNA-binding TFAR19-related protein (PDSD5 family)
MNDVGMQEKIQLEIAKKTLLMRILDKGAYERLARVRIANSMLADQVELYLIQNAQKDPSRISEEKLKQILNLLTTKRKTKIMRR